MVSGAHFCPYLTRPVLNNTHYFLPACYLALKRQGNAVSDFYQQADSDKISLLLILFASLVTKYGICRHRELY